MYCSTIYNVANLYFSANQQRLIQLEDEAKAAGRGRWGEGASKHVRDIMWVIENPRNFVDSYHNKPIDGMISMFEKYHRKIYQILIFKTVN